ncbi:MAG TPA: GNAT family N-acetyltransferase [Gemmatimonadales bacterium]|nr:GNAT family N-acetyltransferase [Gemmatimonadales bacterium]
MTTRVPPRLRDLTSADAERVLDITRTTGVFREDELRIAEEVFADCVSAEGPSGGKEGDPWGRPYYGLGAEIDGQLVGWICWGQTPCTEGTWDLYWLAVDPKAHGRGVGRALVTEMERRLAGRARLISIDTSGRLDYGPTRAFYAAVGYSAVAIVPDFYAPGDDQVIFTKYL